MATWRDRCRQVSAAVFCWMGMKAVGSTEPFTILPDPNEQAHALQHLFPE